ncbi:class I SAM-dependent methyltransferase [Sphingomicrobium sediminis]|uniref:Class I SAM-dependent methyltransferase n=1 Tax=Sphingomicrobium sediminis TaxID=2950949 RepID=A0A9X2J2Z3_9SPHN|nr:class I SAM-dependent methyltransferase [Sphingomicrobium sediminis]MCM8558279.1 class I SAM-dependent methyltransferase [Sphingomicrobium sediminis]
MSELLTLVTQPWDDYALIDCGDGRKYERFGDIRTIRPEPQAMWAPARTDWDAHAEFVPASDADGRGRWHELKHVPATWELSRGPTRFHASLTPFRHLAFFPDMAPQWDFARERLGAGKSAMNLFGYTGVGTLQMSETGADLVHVDASKKSVDGARENAALSGMENNPIRWLVEDAGKFAAREVRRERRYDGIMLDPPKFGRGPKGERWEIETGLAPLLNDCVSLLDADSRFLILTVYAVRMSALSIGELLRQQAAHLPGKVEVGEMGVREEARGLVLPTAIFARYVND